MDADTYSIASGSSADNEQWCFTVIKSHSLHTIRPAKTWRPIVTVNIQDASHQQYEYELTLGVDGKNPNMKDVLSIPHTQHIDRKTRLTVRVWYRSQTKKKKSQKKILAACSEVERLGRLLKKQHHEPNLEIPLQCQTPNRRKSSNRGKALAAQKGPRVQLKIRPPTGLNTLLWEEMTDIDGDELDELDELDVEGGDAVDDEDLYEDEEDQEDADSCESELDLEPPQTPPPPHPSTLRRRRKKRIKGYHIDSDSGDSYSNDGELSCEDIEDQAPPYTERPYEYDSPLTTRPVSIVSWLASSLLPSYSEKATERIPVTPYDDLSRIEKMISPFTKYVELKDACVDSHYERVFEGMLREWKFVGMLLVGIAGVDVAILSISPDSMFQINEAAKTAAAVSCMSSGLGISCSAWFIMRFSWVDVGTCIQRAQDPYPTDPSSPYFFYFSITSRTPSLFMAISAISLMVFMVSVAFETVPWAVTLLLTFFIFGLVLSLGWVGYAIRVISGRSIRIWRFITLKGRREEVQTTRT